MEIGIPAFRRRLMNSALTSLALSWIVGLDFELTAPSGHEDWLPLRRQSDVGIRTGPAEAAPTIVAPVAKSVDQLYSFEIAPSASLATATAR
jgi:hypothetical protein